MAKTTPKKTTKSKAAVPSGKKPAKPATTKSSGKPVAKPASRPATPAKSVKSKPAPVSKPAKAAPPVKSAPAKPAPVIKSAPAAKPGKFSKPEMKAPANHANGTPVKAVATGSKPNKNQAGLKSKDLESFRDLLLAKRRELLGDVHSMEQEALRSASGSNLSNLPIHMADMGTDNYEQEFTLGLVEKDRQLLREINTALAKIQDGTYGICEGTGKPITRARLEAQPWARYSIEHARQMERGMMRGVI